MNCRPGDLAVVCNLVHDTECNGMLVEVESVGLPYLWDAPDGWSWIDAAGRAGCKSLGSPFAHPRGGTMYAPFRQSNLRSIRPGDISDEEVRDLYATKVPEAA